jgi:hypothetical protein
MRRRTCDQRRLADAVQEAESVQQKRGRQDAEEKYFIVASPDARSRRPRNKRT